MRWRDGANRQEKIPVSRTVMDYVLREKEGVLVSDATRDERFQAVQSIVRFGVREVICVPMKGRHETLGVLYLDTRTHGARGDRGRQPHRQVHRRPSRPGGRHRPPGGVGRRGDALSPGAGAGGAAGGRRPDHRGPVASHQKHPSGIANRRQGAQDGHRRQDDRRRCVSGWAIVEKNQGKIYELVMDMLSYSKEREPALEETDLGAVASDVVELIGPRAEELGVTLTRHARRRRAEMSGRPGGRPSGAAQHRRQRPGRGGGDGRTRG